MYLTLGTMKSKDMNVTKSAITHDRQAEKFVAVGSFFAAVLLAFTSVIISPGHDVTGGVLMMCAQFLTLTATIFGIDYKFTQNRSKYEKE